MPSLLDLDLDNPSTTLGLLGDSNAPPGGGLGLLDVGDAPRIAPPDDRTVSPGDALAQSSQLLRDYLARQQAESERGGYWTGGQPWEGGHPTGKGLLDAAQQTGNALLAGSITPGVGPTGRMLELDLNPNAPGFADRISTRLPGARQAPDAHSTADYLVGADSFNTAQKNAYQEKTANIAGWLPGFERFRDNPGLITDPSDVHEALVGHFVDNLRALYDATGDWRKDAMNWYDGANKLASDLAQQHGLDPRQGAGIYAALSPQKDWNENVEMGNRVAHIMSTASDTPMSEAMQALYQRKYNQPFMLDDAGNPLLNRKGAPVENENYKPGWSDQYANIQGKTLGQIPSADSNELGLWIRLYDEAHNPTGNGTTVRVVKPDGSYGDAMPIPMRWNTNNFIGNAASIYRDGSLENISDTLGSGHKVRNFYNNIVSPNAGSDVTIDTHAIAAANLMPWGGSRPEVAYGLGSSSPTGAYTKEGWPTTPKAGVDNGSQGLYPLYAEAYRRLAAEKGILPRQAQSVTWEGIKGLFSDTDRRNDTLINQHSDMWRAFENGDATAADTRAQILGRGINPPDWSRSGGGAALPQ
jgi:hypothetical protein